MEFRTSSLAILLHIAQLSVLNLVSENLGMKGLMLSLISFPFLTVCFLDLFSCQFGLFLELCSSTDFWLEFFSLSSG